MSIKIYIHTWNVFASDVSWRKINANNQQMTDEIIYNYFDKLNNCVKKIIIDDDTNIKLIGNLNGNINNGPMPIIGWKNYWYGKHRIIDYLYNENEINNNENDNEMIVNFRFDLLNNSNHFNNEDLINLIKNNIETKFTKNVFLFNYESNGVDNFYVGNIKTMRKITNTFCYDLDDILSKHNDTIHQERLVYRINSILFDQL